MLTRRDVLKTSAGAALSAALCGTTVGDEVVATGLIPSSQERIPALGMGTWLTFDVADSRDGVASRTAIMAEFFAAGGALIDSSPMYGSSQVTIGRCLENLKPTPGLFAATKVWTPSGWLGLRQMEEATNLWGVEKFDLLQVHNLLNWRTHLDNLIEWRERGQVRYIGVTTSHGRRHSDLLNIIRTQPIDFVQLTYNIRDREAEHEILPAAAEAGIAVIANRPFRASRLFDPVRQQPLPAWAADIDCVNWAQFFLKFIISHPAVTCAIPATSRLAHMRENMGALRGRLPNAGQRQAMAVYYASL
jgi:diketogulonate reductase-like aldo/keto reductase